MFNRSGIVALSILLSLVCGCKSGGSKQTSSSEEPEASAKSAKNEPETSAQELYIQGNDHLDDGDWEAAIEKYRRAVDQNSERWDVWMNMAIAYSKSRQFEKAIGAIEKSLGNGGKGRPEVYFNLGNIHRRRGFYRRAIKAYRTCLAHADELHVDALTNIGSTLVVMNRPKKALKTYRRARKHAPESPRIHHGIALALYHDDQNEASVEAFNRLHSVAPDYVRAYFDAVKPLAELDRNRDAIESLQTYLEKAPNGKFAREAKEQLKQFRKSVGTSDSAQ